MKYLIILLVVTAIFVAPIIAMLNFSMLRRLEKILIGMEKLLDHVLTVTTATSYIVGTGIEIRECSSTYNSTTDEVTVKMQFGKLKIEEGK